MNEQYDDFATLEYRGWQRVANKYESAWSGLTRLFIPDLLQAAEVTGGTRVLDIACGPGYAAEAARSRGAIPTGVDFSAEMVRIAKQRNADIEFQEGDAQALDFDADTFDVVVMNFGLLHLPKPQEAFAEASRVLRSGGRFGFTIWAGPEKSPGARIVDDAVKAHADMSAAVPQGPDFLVYGDAEKCREALSRAGFDPQSLVLKTITKEWRLPTASFLFAAERDAGVRTAAVLARQSPEALKAIQNQIEESVRAYEQERGFVIPYVAHLAVVKAA
jgi:ubiquinone/menaquinone biosynthesis C-methylase UbiE